MVRTTVEHVARALRSERTVLVVDGQVTWSRSADGCVVPVPTGTADDLPPSALREPVEALAGEELVVTRDEPFTHAEQVLLGGMVRVLSLAVQARGLLDSERAQVSGHAELLASLTERQVLLERLSRIQRSISSRQPLTEVLDTIVAGAADLLGEDIVGLRLLDPHDPGLMLLASSIGVPDHLAVSTLRQPVGQGIGGRAIVENALVHTSDYPAVGQPLPGFAADGILSAMAAPLRQGTVAVGSLVVATRRPHRTYSASEQEALTALAEHVSLALNDAHSLAALHQAVADATHQSRHDSLTGLPNRTRFLEELQRASADDPSAGDQPLAVLFIDIDDFKVVNDSLGHPVGDWLLTAVARRVVDGVRSPDVVARLGGDEFAVLMQRTGQDEALRVAERVLAALQLPFELDGHTLHVGASIGLVGSGRGWAQPEELLGDADVAMYRAKAQGKHRCVVFAPGMRDELQARTVLETELRQAVGRGQLTVHFQPVVDARTGRVASTEALLRWEHPRLGLVPPGGFVPLAEDTGLIVAIGAVVLRAACAQTVAWRRAPALADLTVSVNLSPRQLHEGGLVDLVRDVLAETGLPALPRARHGGRGRRDRRAGHGPRRAGLHHPAGLPVLPARPGRAAARPGVPHRGRRSTGQERQPDLAHVVVDVQVDQRDGLPGPEPQLAPQHRHRGVGRHQRRQDVRAAVAGRAVPVPPPVVGREQLAQRREQVVVGAGAELEHGHARRRVRDEDVQQPVPAAAYELGALGAQVVDGLAVAGPDGQHRGEHGLAPTRG
ncbi:MAG: hypothetical protein JWN08_48 [Frankiales bacterium]|nr:hypothetical protein [Frankiales bacterium]